MPILLMLTSAFIAYQDFRYRAVHWVAFVVLLCLLVNAALSHLSLPELLTNSLINLSILLFQWIALTLYFSVKGRKMISIMDKYIGWGDAVLFMVLAAFFPPITFIFFLVIGLLISLLLAVFQIFIFREQNALIPLAGWLSLVLLVWLIADYIHPQELIFSEYALHLVLNTLKLLQ